MSANQGMANTADREIVITRVVNTPRELVWEAMTNPRHGNAYFFAASQSQRNPLIPASRDAARTPVLAISSNSGCAEKPSSAIKIAMVKPMPPSRETPAIWLKQVSAGSCPMSSFIVSCAPFENQN